jgi:hypothetical protein
MIAALRWQDLEPAVHPFDPEGLEAIARDALATDPSQAGLERAFFAAHGAWVAGWSFTTHVGGPIAAWCCEEHSVSVRDAQGLATTVRRAVAAVREWRALLEELAGLFAALGDAPIEHAAARLLPLVLEKTGANDAWYSTLAAFLAWWAQSRGWDATRAIYEVCSGRFSSWVAPDPSVAEQAFRELAARGSSEPLRDALTEWRRTRRAPLDDGWFRGPQQTVRADGHLAWIEGAERRRDPTRATHMREALAHCRASARAGEPLDFAALASWQELVLDRAGVNFRSLEAYAKAGRERYSVTAETQELFERALAEANDRAVCATTRAARVYLDVCFFHPFDDGNGRAARLALDHVLTTAGLALHAAEPLFVISRLADDVHGLRAFARAVHTLSGPVG